MNGELTILIPTPSGWMAVSYETLRAGLRDACDIVKDVNIQVDMDEAALPPVNLTPPIDATVRIYNRTLIDAREAARLFGVKPSWLLKRARERRIPFVRIGKYVRFDPKKIRAFLTAEMDRHANS